MKTIFKKSIIFSLFCYLVLSVSAQQDLTMYSIQSIPYSSFLNPALMPKSNFHIGLPGLSSLHLGVGNSGFNAHDILEMKNDTTLLIKLDDFVKGLKKSNNIRADLDITLFSFGFKVKSKHYFNLSITHKTSALFTYPKELFDFVYYGNGAFIDETISFNKLGVRALQYNEARLGYAYKVDEKLTIGGGFKAIQGLGNIETTKTNISLLTEEENFFITANADVQAFTSVKGFGIGKDSADKEVFDPMAYALNTENRGYGFDIGFNYKFNEKLSFGASIIDIGSITWKSDVVQFKSRTPNASYTYTGINQGEIFDDNNNVSFNDQMKQVLDSVIKIFQLDTIMGGEYTTPLNTKFYFHAFYSLDKKTQLSAVLRLSSYQNIMFPKLQIGATRQFGNFLHLHGNYTVDKNSFSNIGFGVAGNLGPFQMHIVTDNILSGIMFNKYTIVNEDKQKTFPFPRHTKHMNFRLGLNLIIGYKEKAPDKPLF